MNRNLIFRLAEHAAWKQCRRLLVAGRPFDEVHIEIERNICREQRNNEMASCQWIVDGWKAGLEHARQDAIRLAEDVNTASTSTAKQLELFG